MSQHQLALLESSNDLIIKDGVVQRVDQGRYSLQLVRCKLQTFVDEYPLNNEIGFIDIDNDFGKGVDLSDLEIRARAIILSCDGVKSVTSINIELNNRSREATLTFTAETIYGTITSTVEW